MTFKSQQCVQKYSSKLFERPLFWCPYGWKHERVDILWIGGKVKNNMPFIYRGIQTNKANLFFQFESPSPDSMSVLNTSSHRSSASSSDMSGSRPILWNFYFIISGKLSVIRYNTWFFIQQILIGFENFF